MAVNFGNPGKNHFVVDKLEIYRDIEIGRGSFGCSDIDAASFTRITGHVAVYLADYFGTPCAVKEAVATFKNYSALSWNLKEVCMVECRLHCQLNHPNVVKMLGVYLPAEDALPDLVMELMEYNLNSLLESYQNIPMHVKLSVLKDVSKGLGYLHALKPKPIVHYELYTKSIFLTKDLVAKLSDFVVTKVLISSQKVQQHYRDYSCHDFTVTKLNADMLDFLPKSQRYTDVNSYSLPNNVYSFGCIACHVISQKWPTPNERQEHVSKISDGTLKQLIKACLDQTPKKRPMISNVCRRITSHITDHYSDDTSIKMAYSLAMQEGVAESRDLQVLLVGAENAGKTSLISSFLGEKFVERQIATEGADVKVCKIYCKDWVRIDHSAKADLLRHQFIDQFRGSALKKMLVDKTGKAMASTNPVFKRVAHTSHLDATVPTSITTGAVSIASKPRAVPVNVNPVTCSAGFTKAVMPSVQSLVTTAKSTRPDVSTVSSAGRTTTSSVAVTEYKAPKSLKILETSNVNVEDLKEACSSSARYDPDSVDAIVWDFAGQVIFHNSHSLFISETGVPIITFNASLKLTDTVKPREGSPFPPECSTIISGIHYWFQVVDSMCSVKGAEGDLSPVLPTALLAGTHIDKLHPSLKEARKIAKEIILPQLEKEFHRKKYARHLAGFGKGLRAALEQYCFFVSNKDRDEEIDRLKSTAIKAASSLRKEQPVFFLKIERFLLQLNEQVISKAMLLVFIAQISFPVAENSPELDGILKYFHNKRAILHFGQIESLRSLVILSPHWLAKLFSYVITAQSYEEEGDHDQAWQRLIKFGILEEALLDHMLNKFHTDYPSAVQVSKQQVLDILLCFHLIARITRKAWFSDEGYPIPPESGDAFIVPSLVPWDHTRDIPRGENERTLYYRFENGFVPTSLLNQLIADCVCRTVKKNDRLLWMKHGKVGLQLGAHQKYYISRCEEKDSIQLTITSRGDAEESLQDRKHLIDDITKILNNIMEVFMPAVKRKPVLLVHCILCSTLHITMSQLSSNATIFCPASGDAPLPSG